MIVIFDFDHTLFDKKRFFEEDLPRVIGVDKEEFIKTYNENFKDDTTGKVNYSLEKHLEVLGKNDELSKKKINEFLKVADKYLKPGALELLEGFKMSGSDMYLVTQGNPEWQKMKIDQIKQLNKYFNDSHRVISDLNKEKTMEFFKNVNDEIVIINDKPDESLRMEKEIDRKCRIYITDSEYSRDIKYEGKTFKNLEELGKEIFPIGEAKYVSEYKIRKH